ncbi:tetraacyldisaccharide 4'-kinase [Moraxella marmotae]|uniref:tetraacyldisaccharide 4'-kinase n=1 Tax=Moraxella marmotae TaxID=3344520 RepID=UPI0035F4C4DB
MKKAELMLTHAWQTQSPLLGVLAPLSALYGTVSRVRKLLYQSGKLSVYHAPVPVWVIGNITVGGSGKTPLIIALLKHLLAYGVKVAVISRGYGGDAQAMPRLVGPSSQPNEVGDEPCLIVQSLSALGYQVPMAVGANRDAVIELLLDNFSDIQLIISDDGLQHYALHRDEEWIVVDAMRGFGNGKLLPQGFLREPVERLDGATVIYHDKTITQGDKFAMTLKAGELIPLMDSVDTDLKPPQSGSRVHAVSGIGYPARFFATLSDLGYQVVPQPFGDHHDFCYQDLLGLDDLPIITTAKDAVKLRKLAEHSEQINQDKQAMAAIFNNIWVLPVEAVLSDSLIAHIHTLLDKYQLGNRANLDN